MCLLPLRDGLEQQHVYEGTQLAVKQYDYLFVCLVHILFLTKPPPPPALIFVEAYSHCDLYNFFIYGCRNRLIVFLQAFNINFHRFLNIS